ncbi:MAG: hypothetical protein PVJ52_03080 [Candidatus Woesebacteria bacterium]|jgi:hypothetical protein
MEDTKETGGPSKVEKHSVADVLGKNLARFLKRGGGKAPVGVLTRQDTETPLQDTAKQAKDRKKE